MRSNYIKQILLFCLLVGTYFSASSQENLVIDRLVANVGDEVVLLSDIEEQYAFDSERTGGLPPTARCFILERILVQKLLINQAKLDSVIVPQESVESQLDSRIEYILGQMGNDVRQFEDYYGKSIAQVRNEFREDLRQQMTAEQMQQKAIENTKITPSEVRTFFNNILPDSLPYFSSEVELGEIVLKPEVNPEEKQKAMAKLTSIKERIQSGKDDFASMAKLYSDDLGSASAGGDLRLQRRGTFVPAFEAAAYNLEVGEMSDIVESEFGLHLIELMDRRGNLIHTRHILIKPEITEEDLIKTENKLDSIRTIFLTDSFSFEALVKRFSHEKVQSYTNGGRMLNPKTGNTFFETGELETDIFFAIDTLQAGEISRPFMYSDQGGDKYFRIVLVQSRTDPHKANLSQDYTKIKQAAIEQRKSEFLNKWLINKIKTTYVKIDPQYTSKCEVLLKWDSDSRISP
jgi:peptidyl-prolyl cis-trans isomerase SurA